MSKNTTFESTTPLTVDHFNSFVQDSQIVQETGNSKTDVMSQEAVTNALKYLEYGAASKANCVFHATGKVQNNIIKACTDKPFDTVIPGTTVIVKMEDNYTYSGSYARLDAGGKLCDIVLRYGENANAAVKRIYYTTSVPTSGSDVYARNVFIKGASYEFYYDGYNWVLKNAVVSSGKNYKIWSDGFVEQWGKIYVAGDDAKNITFGVIFADFNYVVSLAGWAGIPSSGLGGTAYHPGLGISVKYRDNMTVYNDLLSATADWYVRGY